MAHLLVLIDFDMGFIEINFRFLGNSIPKKTIPTQIVMGWELLHQNMPIKLNFISNFLYLIKILANLLDAHDRLDSPARIHVCASGHICK